MTLQTITLGNDFSQTLALKDNAFFCGNISPTSIFQLRLTRTFCAAASIIYDDMLASPWKILPCTVPSFGLGTAIITLTAGYYLLSPTEKAVAARHKIRNAMTGDIDYKLYLHFMEANNDPRYPIKINSKKLRGYYNQQARAHLLDAGYALAGRLPDGRVRRFVQQKIGKKLSLGQLVPVGNA